MILIQYMNNSGQNDIISKSDQAMCDNGVESSALKRVTWNEKLLFHW